MCVCVCVCVCFEKPNSSNTPFSRSLMYRWSDDEELRLGTSSEEFTHLKHELKLYNAYLGVLVCLLISLFFRLFVLVFYLCF